MASALEPHPAATAAGRRIATRLLPAPRAGGSLRRRFTVCPAHGTDFLAAAAVGFRVSAGGCGAGGIFWPHKPTLRDAARAIDRHANTGDLFLTTILLEGSPGEFQPLVSANAEKRRRHDPRRDVAPLAINRRLAAAAPIICAVVAIVFFVPQLDPIRPGRRLAGGGKRIAAAQPVEEGHRGTARADRSREGFRRRSQGGQAGPRRAQNDDGRGQTESSERKRRDAGRRSEKNRRSMAQAPVPRSSRILCRTRHCRNRWEALRGRARNGSTSCRRAPRRR